MLQVALILILSYNNKQLQHQHQQQQQLPKPCNSVACALGGFQFALFRLMTWSYRWRTIDFGAAL